MTKVLVGWKPPGFERIPGSVDGFDVRVHDNPAEILREIEDAEIGFLARLDSTMLAAAKKLRWVQAASGGVESYLFPEFVASSITFTCAKPCFDSTGAEHAMAVILAWSRRMHVDLRLRPGDEWSFSHPTEARSRTVGLIGYGTMGQAVARRAKAFEMRVAAMARQARPKPKDVDDWFGPGQLRELLAISDFVVLAVPKTPDTVGMIGNVALRAMKPGALLVDLSGRDSLYDLNAIVQALEERRIGGACLQLPPPPADSKLWMLDNLILSYHRVVSVDEIARCTDLFVENLKRYRAGQPLLGLVDKQAGY